MPLDSRDYSIHYTSFLRLQALIALMVIKACVAIVKRSPGYVEGGVPVQAVAYDTHVPIPTPVHVAHPIGVPYPVPVPDPVPVHVPIEVPIIKTVQVPIERPVPYEVVKPYTVEVIQKIPIPIPKPYPVPVKIVKVKHHFKEIITPHHSW
ncbi:MAGE-like protein 2 isoform X1 [Halyomorpha halys]|uniref:MAGE-like protein 2 isoform X1 n=1 Tax=Halyomorpha halys TaxID=286706 RepID=UPI0006D50CBB|nr:tetra-peptide repeat homeobox protein 1-like isoform X1 [Halyomorpha halys]